MYYLVMTVDPIALYIYDYKQSKMCCKTHVDIDKKTLNCVDKNTFEMTLTNNKMFIMCLHDKALLSFDIKFSNGSLKFIKTAPIHRNYRARAISISERDVGLFKKLRKEGMSVRIALEVGKYASFPIKMTFPFRNPMKVVTWCNRCPIAIIICRGPPVEVGAIGTVCAEKNPLIPLNVGKFFWEVDIGMVLRDGYRYIDQAFLGMSECGFLKTCFYQLIVRFPGAAKYQVVKLVQMYEEFRKH
jgi:hypothetical protein